jgi:uncharacterized alkaline shock family protein YloU
MENNFQKNNELMKMDEKEIDLPETTYVRDIESRVFQGIVLKCLSKIEGIGLIGGNLIDSLLGRDTERIKGIHVDQEQKRHSVFIRVEANIMYGISIPAKAEEIQTKIIEEITSYTGLHVSCVHVIFKNLIIEEQKLEEEENKPLESIEVPEEEYTHGF